MSGKLEYPEHSDEPDHSEYRQGHRLVRTLVLRAYRRLWFIRHFLLLGHHGTKRDKIRNDGDDIDEIHYITEEVQLIWTGEEAHR